MKTRPLDHTLVSSTALSKHSSSEQLCPEFFYNIRYVAKTGRDSWPWSYRRMGVYHKHYFKNGSSTWIILQPTAAAKRLPTLTLTNRDFAAILPHAFLFQSTAQSWRAYLKHLEYEVRKDVCPVSLYALYTIH